jgi:hypothetical protein
VSTFGAQNINAAASNVQQQQSVQQANLARRMAAYGLNPGSGAWGNQATEANIAASTAEAGAKTNASIQNELTQEGLVSNAVGQLQGLPGQTAAAANTATGAGNAAVSAGAAPISVQSQAAGGVGAGYNAAMTGYGNEASILGNQYNAQLATWQANQASQNALWGGLGQAGGLLGAAYMMMPAAAARGGLIKAARGGLMEERPALRLIHGGKIEGPGTGTSDSVPVAASDGEYIVNADSVRVFGTPFLDVINKVGLDVRDKGKIVPLKRPVKPQRAVRAAAGGM